MHISNSGRHSAAGDSDGLVEVPLWRDSLGVLWITQSATKSHLEKREQALRCLDSFGKLRFKSVISKSALGSIKDITISPFIPRGSGICTSRDRQFGNFGGRIRPL